MVSRSGKHDLLTPRQGRLGTVEVGTANSHGHCKLSIIGGYVSLDASRS